MRLLHDTVSRAVRLFHLGALRCQNSILHPLYTALAFVKGHQKDMEEVPTLNVLPACVAKRRENTFGFSSNNRVSAFISS